MVDAVTERVITNYLFTVAEEMGIITMRTARSNVIKEGGDFSTALYDNQGRLAQHGRDMPAHQGLFPVLIKQALTSIDLSSLSEGDVFITNAEDVAGSHLNDVKVFCPLFYKGELVMWAANLSHWPDVGGVVPGSYYGQATEIFQEGLQIPLVKIVDGGRMRDDLVSLILKNVRGAKERMGDLRAQIASLVFAGKRINELFDKYGKDTVFSCFDSLISYSEFRMRQEIRELPDGVYKFEDYMDNDGVENRPVKISVTISIQDDEIEIDFSNSDIGVRGPVNSPFTQTCSAAYYAVRAITDHTIPTNDGVYRPITVVTTKGSVVDALPTVPRVYCTHETATRLVDVCLGALFQVAPERVPAAGYGSSYIMIVGGRDPRSDDYYAWYEPIVGGFGARPTMDGIDGTRVHMGNTANTPVEVFERDYPLVCDRYEFLTDSGGAGKYRGGLGVVKEIRPIELPGNEPVVTSVSDRNLFSPYGLMGGLPATRGRFVIINADGAERLMPGECPGKTSYHLEFGERWAAFTPGGGGHGNSLERDPHKVLQDVIEEKVSIGAAWELYGVAVRSSSMSIDWEKTTEERRLRLGASAQN